MNGLPAPAPHPDKVEVDWDIAMAALLALTRERDLIAKMREVATNEQLEERYAGLLPKILKLKQAMYPGQEVEV